MKHFVPLVTAILLTATVSLSAQEKEKPGRKTMVFQPGAKAPDQAAATPAPATRPAPAASAAAAPTVAGAGGGHPEPGQAAANFFALLQKNQIEDAYTGLMKGSKIAERPEELRTLKTKTVEAIELFGPVLGFDLLETKEVGPHMMRRTYLSLGRDFPLRWRFYFYRVDAQWRLVDLRVDDRLTGIFDESEEAKADAPPTAAK